MKQFCRCPSCGRPIEYDAENQKIICNYCNVSYSIEKFAALYEEDEDWESELSEEHKTDMENGEFRTFKCPSCGLEILTDINTSAATCFWCNNNSIMKAGISKEKMPSFIIPFKIDKKQAKEKYQEWLKTGLFTPFMFYKKSIIENITGIYVPCLLYDYKARIKLTALCTKETRKNRGYYRYTYTENYLLARDLEIKYNRVLGCASEKISNDLFEKAADYHYSDMKKFEIFDLSDYYMDKYSNSNNASEYAEKKLVQNMYNTVEDMIQGYDKINIKSKKSKLHKLKSECVLVPIWMFNYKYKGRDYMFVLNGQTGKIAAVNHVSKVKIIIFLCGIIAIFFIVFMMIGRFM